ncbi:MAG: 2-oxoglutarate dehydrogenase E1 component [Deltaproteobacteria bacterium]|nr:2-oxoglutarate dehydrogenase E1 component [Deltaproteobacteria bacterium]
MSQDFGVNQGLVEELYLQYRANPASVSDAWRKFFDGLDEEPLPPRRTSNGTTSPGRLTSPGFVTTPPTPTISSVDSSSGTVRADRISFAPGPETRVATELQSRVSAMVNAYRARGHLLADLDPLDILPRRGANRPPDELSLAAFGLGDVDLDTQFNAMAQQLTLREIHTRLEETYCRTIGVEVTQLEDNEERDWLQTRMESTRNHLELTRERQLHLLAKLTEAEVWETFIHKAYTKKKRFSLEGGESTIPLIEMIILRGAQLGVEEVVIGMAHRGRLNMLLNIMELPARDMLAAFEDSSPERLMGTGDVKYHLGYSNDRVFDGRSVHLTMSFNPSHLEFVNPVVEGRVRAKQDRRGDSDRTRVVPLLVHGDAAFIGQGIVAETLNLANLEGYTTGGTIHVVINNQLGYTTVAADARSTQYCTDLVRMLRCPVFHVNGEDPEAVAQVATLAAEYRQRFHKDVVVDLYCYRKYGHNEGDEPRFTQPLMYQAIDAKDTVRKIYVKKLLELGKITQEEADAVVAMERKALDDALNEVRETKRTYQIAAFGGLWTAYKGGPDIAVPDVPTGVEKARLEVLLRTLGSVPEGFQLMRQIGANRKEYLDAIEGAKMKWGVAENLAYATLLADGHTVRLTGQDTRRGTFAHRQAVAHDAATGQQYTALEHVADALTAAGQTSRQGRLELFDSPLSEQGCLGFEWGYSLDCPDGLVVWEAQFGDFANGAQVIIDQFLASSEDKWHRLSGLVMLLPHGYEGAGPEHSSARLERFLALAAEDNLTVVNLTSAAQIFHALRRQVVRPMRKPLIVMSPKSLFRSPQTECTVEQLVSGGFQRIIADAEVPAKKVKRVLLCSGKVYFDLAEHRRKESREDVAIVRFEQLYPLRVEEVREALAPYADGTDVVWVQEEPFNSGAWYFMNARLPAIIGDRFGLRCVSRVESASPATGSEKAHGLEQEQLIKEAFAPSTSKSARPSARPRAQN